MNESACPTDQEQLCLSVTGESLHPQKLSAVLGHCCSIRDYDFQSKIGEGISGIVYRAREKETGCIVAVKRMQILDPDEEGDVAHTVLREIAILQSSRHENIISVLNIACSEEDLYTVYMIMEYCDRDLAALADQRKFHFVMDQVKCIAYQLLSALEHLHYHDIIHRDVKLDNILVKSDGTIKLADFGASRPYSSLEARPMTPGMVTVWYRAPELLLGTYNYTPAVDIWAAGMVIGELLLNAPVLPGTDQDQLSRIVTLIGEPSPQDYDALERIGCEALATWYSDELQPGPGSPLGKRFYNNGGEVTVRYLRGFFDWNPRNRWTATEALGKLDDEFAMPTKAWWEAAPPAMPKERLGHILCGGVQDSRSFVLESRPKEEVDLEGKMKKHRMSSVKDGNPNVLDADGNGSDLRPIEKKKKQ